MRAKDSIMKNDWYTRNKKVEDGILYDHNTGRAWEHFGESKKIHWTAQMLSDLRRLFPKTKNEVLAGILGVGTRTMIRKARELGLEKDKEWLSGIWDTHRRMAHMMGRAMGYPGRIMPGEHRNPEGEYKKGHRLTDEQMRKKAESTHRWAICNKRACHDRSVKAWETRRKKQEQK